MVFNYDLTEAVGQVRLELGDTDEAAGAGVKPDGSNFSDEELTYFLTTEGDDVLQATARACEALARSYARLVNLSVGPRREDLGTIAESYAKRAQALRGTLRAGVLEFNFTATAEDDEE